MSDPNDLVMTETTKIKCTLTDLALPLYCVSVGECLVTWPYLEPGNEKVEPSFWLSICMMKGGGQVQWQSGGRSVIDSPVLDGTAPLV